MCKSICSFHHKSVSSYSYSSIPLYFVLFLFVCALRSWLLSLAHCILSLILSGICSFRFFASSSACILISSCTSFSIISFPSIRKSRLKVGYICPQVPAEFLSHRIISDNPFEHMSFCSHSIPCCIAISASTSFS